MTVKSMIVTVKSMIAPAAVMTIELAKTSNQNHNAMKKQKTTNDATAEHDTNMGLCCQNRVTNWKP